MHRIQPSQLTKPRTHGLTKPPPTRQSLLPIRFPFQQIPGLQDIRPQFVHPARGPRRGCVPERKFQTNLVGAVPKHGEEVTEEGLVWGVVLEEFVHAFVAGVAFVFPEEDGAFLVADKGLPAACQESVLFAHVFE